MHRCDPDGDGFMTLPEMAKGMASVAKVLPKAAVTWGEARRWRRPQQYATQGTQGWLGDGAASQSEYTASSVASSRTGRQCVKHSTAQGSTCLARTDTPHRITQVRHLEAVGPLLFQDWTWAPCLVL